MSREKTLLIESVKLVSSMTLATTPLRSNARAGAPRLFSCMNAAGKPPCRLMHCTTSPESKVQPFKTPSPLTSTKAATAWP